MLLPSSIAAASISSSHFMMTAWKSMHRMCHKFWSINSRFEYEHHEVTASKRYSEQFSLTWYDHRVKALFNLRASRELVSAIATFLRDAPLNRYKRINNPVYIYVPNKKKNTGKLNSWRLPVLNAYTATATDFLTNIAIFSRITSVPCTFRARLLPRGMLWPPKNACIGSVNYRFLAAH